MLKQIIGWGFVFRNKVAGMFSYSVSFVVFLFSLRNYALFMDTFCIAAWKYAFPKIGVKRTPVILRCPVNLLFTQKSLKTRQPFQSKISKLVFQFVKVTAFLREIIEHFVSAQCKIKHLYSLKSGLETQSENISIKCTIYDS